MLAYQPGLTADGVSMRQHDDLDLVIALRQVTTAAQALSAIGFTIVEDELPTRFVMQNTNGRSIDFHPVTFDEQGNGIQQLQDGRQFSYPCDGFTGHGYIAGQAVCCLTAEVQVLCHLGYTPDENDFHDMRLLGHHFKLNLPDPYSERSQRTNASLSPDL
jgi:lincosamide nucleotidyltransferase A/C/D/E